MLVRKVGEEDWEDGEQYLYLFSPEYADEDDFAEAYGEYLYNLDPSDPEKVDINIEVMNKAGDIRRFNITAHERIHFRAEEIEELN